MPKFKSDEGRAWAVVIAAFLGVGIITDGIGVSKLPLGINYTVDANAFFSDCKKALQRQI